MKQVQTIKEDIYAYPSKPVQFLTETIYIEFIGILFFDIKLFNDVFIFE